MSTGANDPHAGQPILRRGVPLGDARAAVILLHGRGASADDILGLSYDFDSPGLAFLAPEAAGHTWYPNSFLVPISENEPWLSSALARVVAAVELATASGIPNERIAVCGFSQGACLATEFVAREGKRFGALIALTGGLAGTGQEVEEDHSRPPSGLAGMPAFFGSGDPDPHVPWSRVERSAAILSAMGANVRLARYPGRPHTVSRAEIEIAADLIRKLA